MPFSIRLALSAVLAAAATVQAAPQTSATAASASTSSPSSSSSASSGIACNNSPLLCDRKYNNVTYMGAHDSSFLRDAADDDSIAGNQYENATYALDAGLRFLQSQVHYDNGTLQLCHTSCELIDAGPLADWLALIKDWMASNPHDVVTLLLVNSDSRPASEFGQAFSSSGLDKYGYTPASQSATTDWPTLQAMIDEDQRLVPFITNIEASSTYPYLLSEFDYVFETQYQITTPSGFNCTLNRPSTESSASSALQSGFMGLVNHFMYQTVSADIFIPDVSAINTTNSNGTQTGELGEHLDECASQWDQKPNFALVDFWNMGQTVQAADHQNGLTQNDISGRSHTGTGSNVASSDGPSAFKGKSLAAPQVICLSLALFMVLL